MQVLEEQTQELIGEMQEDYGSIIQSKNWQILTLQWELEHMKNECRQALDEIELDSKL